MKHRTKLYALAEDGTWIDKGAGWCDVVEGQIVVNYDVLPGQMNIRQFKSVISQNPEDFQLEGGMCLSFMYDFAIVNLNCRYIDYLG